MGNNTSGIIDGIVKILTILVKPCSSIEHCKSNCCGSCCGCECQENHDEHCQINDHEKDYESIDKKVD